MAGTNSEVRLTLIGSIDATAQRYVSTSRFMRGRQHLLFVLRDVTILGYTNYRLALGSQSTVRVF
jgi:hypothetical protein